MTDVWTSLGVIGVGLVWLSGWLWLDPVIAILVAMNIVWTGWQLMQRSAAGLMDISLPPEKLERVRCQHWPDIAGRDWREVAPEISAGG
ncbi:MAG: hypothetical protein A2045_10220 [Rhodocyclales bacterium GWA2_65_20]|nr:MAG: hypothetical protein A2045_10220 [Rhodocyclales bacterium GWA2_65_20]